MKRLFIFFMALLVFVVGCTAKPQTSGITPAASPTASATATSTVALTPTPSPTATIAVTPTATLPALTPLATPSGTPQGTPASVNYRVPEDYNGKYAILVNRKQNIVTVYTKDDDGRYTKLVRAFVCSVGKVGKATPTGTYYTTEKYVWRPLNGGTYGQYATRIFGAYLFHSVPYSAMDKSTLLAEEYNKLGERASLGCIRITVENAKWIYDNCPIGTCVVIYSSRYVEPVAQPAYTIDVQDPRNGWDPTDPDENNPWNN